MLSSAKLRLRALEPEDVNLLFKWENDYTLWEEGITNVPFSRYELKQYIINVKDIFSDRQYRFMIEDCLSQKAIGTLDLFEFDLMNLRAEVGIYIEKDSRQQGYA
ncbi:MAG: GNAT family N-acetyltransferase, partial [Paludibacteraceae bacterium]|nr:GNAT family N-acetyltransferase [Paludibacteraceae bacterium]